MGERGNKILFFLFPALLVIIIGVIAWNNYTPGTWLSGWDVLHPEFDFPLAFNRAFYGVWRSDQGLGTVAVHSHMSDLPRIVFLWLSSFTLSTNVLRYFYFFVTLILGPLGVYFFVRNAISEGRGRVLGVLSASFLAGMYYLFNFATLQLYYVPFEMFASQFAGLPWLFYLSFKYVNDGKRLLLLAVFLVSFLASPMAYAATLFYAFYISIFVFLLTYSLLHRKGKIVFIKHTLLVLSVILLANIYWLLPNIYSVSTQSDNVSKATINRVFSPEAFLSNKAYGDLESVLTFKNHLFSWREYDTPNSNFVDLLDEWNIHIASGSIEQFLKVIVLIVLVGFVLSLVRKDKVGIALIPVSLIALFFLINENPPFESLYSYLRTHLEIFREGFRMPFTKFSLILVFSFSYYFTYFLKFLFDKCLAIKQDLLKYSLFVLVLVVPFTLLFEIYKPYFSGNLISPSMRVNIPGAYLELFRYMQDKDGRIAKLPMHTPYGWTYYSWDYEGAGFIPFGLANPTLDRDFDRWSAYNESFYNEAGFALYSGSLGDFERVLEKYDVGYLVLDESIINAGGDEGVLRVDEIKKILDESNIINLEEKIGFLTVYKTNFDRSYPLWSPESISNVDADLEYSQTDPLYAKYGVYKESKEGVVYPFVNFDKRSGLKVSIEENGVHLSKELGLGKVEKVVVPAFGGGNLPVGVYAKLNTDGLLTLRFSPQTPKIIINDNEIRSQEYSQIHEFEVGIKNPKYLVIDNVVFALANLSQEEKYVGTIQGFSEGEVDISIYANDIKYPELEKDLLDNKARLCADPTQEYLVENVDGELAIEVGSDAVCFGRNFNVPKDGVWILNFKTKSQDGIFPNVCVTEDGLQKCLESYLPGAYLWEEDGWKLFEMMLPLKSGEHWLDFVSSNPSDEGISKIFYKDINVEGVELYEQTYYPIQWNFPANSLNENIIENVNIDKIDLVFPITNQLYENFYLQRGNKDAKNCDVKKAGIATKINTGTDITYTADDGAASCDYFNYPQLKDYQSYVLGVEGENIKGRSLKVYLYNDSYDKAYIEELLPSGKFEEYFITTAKDLGGKGYTLNLETRAFSTLGSANKINAITFTPIPQDWLAGIKIEKGGSLDIKDNTLTFAEAKEIHPWAYKVKGVEGKGILVLSQSYDPGWVAYKGEFNIFGPLKERLEHTEVSGWANGWFVDDSDCANGCTVVMIYLPQYLQTFGFVLLAIVLVSLSVGVFSEVRKKV